MARNSIVPNSPVVKSCEQCSAEFAKRDSEMPHRFRSRRFCSVKCSAKAVYSAPPPDLSGQVFGRWTVGTYAGRNRQRNHSWNCVCDCGRKGVVDAQAMLSGKSLSCGCLRKEKSGSAAKSRSTHGKSKTAPEYYVWCSMKQRCLNPNVRNWNDYGGRGIAICDRWLNSFANFLEDMGPRPSPQHSIDRIDNDGNYTPENCRWHEKQDQMRNRRSNIWIEIDGDRVLLVDAAARAGLKYSTVRMRYRKGWPIERLLEPCK